jgi:LysM repeat protein
MGTAAAWWRWAWLGCLPVLVLGTAGLWAGSSQALFADIDTSHGNWVEAAPGCWECIAEDDHDVGVDETDAQGESGPDDDAGNPGESVVAEYQVRPGDTLWAIAIRFDTTVEALVRLNQLRNPNLIFHGSTLNVPYVGEDPGDASAGMVPWHGRTSVRRIRQ